MGLLNGLNGLAGGVGAVAQKGLEEAKQEEADKDAVTSLLNRAPLPVADVAAPPAAASAQTIQDAPAQPQAAAAPASSAALSSVPAELLPIYKSASVRTGIPVSLLVAQGKQESGWRNEATSPTGAIGIAQILPSTARDPGYGLKPIDPDQLRNPVVAINFQADYMRARAGGPGADFSNPSTVRTALTAYNGNSDPQYVSKVTGHMVRGY